MNLSNFYDTKIWNQKYSTNIAGFYSQKRNFFDMKMHAHPRVEIMYIAGGKANLFVQKTTLPGKKEQKINSIKNFVLKKNDLIFLNSGVKHRLFINDDCKIYNIEFDFRMNTDDNSDALQGLYDSSRGLRDFVAGGQQFTVLKDADGRISGLFSFLMHELAGYLKDDGTALPEISGISGDVIDNIMKIIILLIARSNNETKSESGEIHVKKALDIISRQFDTEIKIEDICKEIGISQAYLHRLSKQHLKMTLHDHINHLRLNKARKYLESSDLPITEIAFHCGFNSRQSFYKSFYKHTGMSARDYRKKYSSEQNKLVYGYDFS
jgi:AraC-like DNA-binding protein